MFAALPLENHYKLGLNLSIKEFCFIIFSFLLRVVLFEEAFLKINQRVTSAEQNFKENKAAINSVGKQMLFNGYFVKLKQWNIGMKFPWFYFVFHVAVM